MLELPQQFKVWAEKIARFFGENGEWGVNNQAHEEASSTLFNDINPLSNWLPYEVYDPEHKIFINKKSIGFILEASTLTGATNETEDILASIITDVLPIKADLQFLLWASPKIGPILQAFEKERSGKGEIYEWLAKERVKFLNKGAFHSLTSSGYFMLRDFKLYIILSLPKENIAAQTQELIELRQDMQSTLKSIHIVTRDIPIDNFISFISDLINPSRDTIPTQQAWNELDALNLQLTNPEYRLRCYPHKLLFDSEEESFDVRCFTVKHFPHKASTQFTMTENIGQLFNSALQIPCPFLMSLSVKPVDHEQSVAQAQVKYMNKEKNAASQIAKFKPTANKEYQDWTYVRQRLSEGDRLVKVFYQVVTYADPEQANSVERKLRDLYRANGWNLRKERFIQLPTWLSLLPMAMTEGFFHDYKVLGRLRTLTGFNVSQIAPLQAEWKGLQRPSLLLPGRRGQLAVWNPFDNPEGNYNVAIAAASGRGKSVFTQEYIVSMLGSGGRVWVIDVGRSYEKTCRMLGGEFIEFKTETPININPFTFIQEFDESLEMLKPLTATMARPSSKTTDEEMAWLEKGLKAAWQEKGRQACISTVAAWLEKQFDPVCKNLAHLLYPYTRDGMYGRFFEGECSINLNNAFVVLELEELKQKKDLQKIVLLVLMYQISERMYLGNRLQPKSCIIDEAWDLFKDSEKEAAEFTETGYRRARRYRGNFITITQSVNDYFKNAMSMAAFENSDFKIILGQSPESLAQLKESKRFELDDFTEKLLKSLKKTDEYSECAIKSPSGISVHRIILDPYSRILYSSKGEEFEAVKHLQTLGFSLHDAIAHVANRRFKHA